MSVCIIRKLAADHCGNDILSIDSFFSWEDFNTILASPEVPSTVSLSSCSTMGRELMKSDISKGRLPREVVGSNSC